MRVIDANGDDVGQPTYHFVDCRAMGDDDGFNMGDGNGYKMNSYPPMRPPIRPPANCRNCGAPHEPGRCSYCLTPSEVQP